MLYTLVIVSINILIILYRKKNVVFSETEAVLLFVFIRHFIIESYKLLHAHEIKTLIIKSLG